MDRPATVAAAVIGVVLIGVTMPYYFLDGGGEASEYLIAWSESTAASRDGTTGSANQEQSLELVVTDVIPSNAEIELTSCNDGALPVQQPATVTWTLTWENHTEEGTASCANQGPFRVAIEPQPEVGSAQGSSAAEARAAAYASANANETVTFTLTYSWSRPGAPGGLPLPPPAFTAGIRLTVDQWDAVANLPDTEVPR